MACTTDATLRSLFWIVQTVQWECTSRGVGLKAAAALCLQVHTYPSNTTAGSSWIAFPAFQHLTALKGLLCRHILVCDQSLAPKWAPGGGERGSKIRCSFASLHVAFTIISQKDGLRRGWRNQSFTMHQNTSDTTEINWSAARTGTASQWHPYMIYEKKSQRHHLLRSTFHGDSK